jgi:hypothetical protein
MVQIINCVDEVTRQMNIYRRERGERGERERERRGERRERGERGEEGEKRRERRERGHTSREEVRQSDNQRRRKRSA